MRGTLATTFAKPKLASVVARRIEDDIVAMGWPVGSVVSSEAELLQRFGVSRAVLREAVRIVEHTGVARMRRGPGGGLVVQEPRRDAVAMAAGVWYSSLGVSFGEMLDAQSPLLTAAVRAAAQHGDEDAFRRLDEFMAEMDEGGRLGAEEFLELDRRIAELSGNAALVLFVRTLGEVGRSRLGGTGARLDPPLTEADARRHLELYRRLVSDMRSGDTDASEARVVALKQAVRRRVHDRAPRPRRRPVLLEVPSGKLGERVAASIRDEIERAGWPIGAVIGSEADLIERYGVSRSILREANRILEHHGAVQTKRGPGGGIVVAQPDGSALAHAARMALQYDGVSGAQLWDARSVVEGACVRLAAERITDPSAAALRAALAREAAGGERAIREHVVHHDIAVASGNRPLVLFVDVLASLTRAEVRRASAERPFPPAAASEAHRVHELIIEAVLDGDTARAERRMQRHLAAAGREVRGAETPRRSQ